MSLFLAVKVSFRAIGGLHCHAIKKIETIQRQKLWISDVIEDKQINHLSKSQVYAAHRLRVICRNFPRKFRKLSMETPYLCPSEGHKHGRRDVRENIWNLILLLIATSFGS